MQIDQAAVRRYEELLDALHSHWTPHVVQREIGRALFWDNKRSLFIAAGRKLGKTELAIYILWRWAMTYPNTGCYYIAPLLNQAREIVWADPRLQSFGPRDWLLDGSIGINNTEMRLRFKNGSFIKVDGSDNYDKHRGTRPGILIYEEYKDHRKEFREVMRPNLSVYNAPEIFIGTPPEDDGNEAQNEFLLTEAEHKRDPRKFYMHAPTSSNPNISRAWLADEEARLRARGEADVWEREYMARFVKGGSKKIFPMLTPDCVKPHYQVLNAIMKDRRKLDWYMWADPAGASCFAVLFAAINPYTKHVYLLDEIYETSQAEMTVQKIGRRMLATKAELFIDKFKDWRMGYDEAETWFANEMLEHFSIGLEPSQKSKSDKISGLSLIKDIMLTKRLTISDRCEKSYWEMDSYCKDDSGKIPKKNDHIVDCFRYLLEAAHYSLNLQTEPEKKPVDETMRGHRMEDDFPNLNGNSWETFG